MDEQQLRSPARAGVFRFPPNQGNALATSAGAAGLTVLRVEIGPISGKEAVLSDLGHALHFPSWYGTNFDALFDCLTDPEWQPAPGHFLLISGLGALQTADPENFSALIEVFRAATDSRRDAGMPFWILLDVDVPEIPLLPEA